MNCAYDIRMPGLPSGDYITRYISASVLVKHEPLRDVTASNTNDVF